MNQLQALAIHVGVGVDEAGDDGGTAEVDHPGAAIAPAAHVAGATHGDDAPALHGQGAGGRPGAVEGQDPAVGENPVGRYFIHPFSR